ncbi:transcriptional regulator, partial [Pseudoalteromonas aliena]
EFRGEELINNVDQLLQTSRLDGIVLTPPFGDFPELDDFLKSKNIPYARVASALLHDDSISVRSNYEQGAFEIT